MSWVRGTKRQSFPRKKWQISSNIAGTIFVISFKFNVQPFNNTFKVLDNPFYFLEKVCPFWLSLKKKHFPRGTPNNVIVSKSLQPCPSMCFTVPTPSLKALNNATILRDPQHDDYYHCHVTWFLFFLIFLSWITPMIYCLLLFGVNR
jgi:hypothetical protein